MKPIIPTLLSALLINGCISTKNNLIKHNNYNSINHEVIESKLYGKTFSCFPLPSENQFYCLEKNSQITLLRKRVCYDIKSGIFYNPNGERCNLVPQIDQIYSSK